MTRARWALVQAGVLLLWAVLGGLAIAWAILEGTRNWGPLPGGR